MENVTDSLHNPVYTIGKLQIIDQEKLEKDRLLAQAQRDGLTGLYHAKALRQHISAVLDSDPSGVLFILDIAQAIKEPADALEKGQRLLERLHQIAITNDQPITVSIGAAISRPGQSYDELYQQADQALYQAKRKGRNCLELYQTQA